MNAVAVRIFGPILFACVAVVAAAQQSHDALDRPRAKAAQDNQRILLLLQDDSSFGVGLAAALRDDGAGRQVRYEYQLAALPGDSLAGKTLRERLGLDGRELPLLAALDPADDRLLGALDAQEMGRDPASAAIATFLAAHAAPPRDARAALTAGLAAASESDRHVFLYLTAPWCGWCHRLASFLEQETVRSAFAKDYVVVRIDTDRMSGGEELAGELRDGKDGGIPWMVILDSSGKPKVTSDGPQGNCGCPVDPHEIEHFLAMIDQTRRHMTDDDRTVLDRELVAFAGTIRSAGPEEAGRAPYLEAIQAVADGRFTAAVAALGSACAAGLAAERLLAEPRLHPLREDPDRRPELFGLLAKHVRTQQIAMVDPYEPGMRIRLVGRIVDAVDGEPLAGALVQLFHTDTTGEYRPGMDAGGGAGNPRLFGYLRTAADGGFVVDTIMPERYPDSTVPRHVHYRITIDGRPEFSSECVFADDPNHDERAQAQAERNGFPIVTLRTDSAARQVGELTVRVPAR